MALSTEDTARLATLKAAYDRLIGGSNVEEVTTAGGRRVKYGQGDVKRLKAEIDRLEDQAIAPPARRGGAIRFTQR